jgi:hypothetical protein
VNGHGGHAAHARENVHGGFRLTPLPGPNQFFDGLNVPRNNNPLMQQSDFQLHPFSHAPSVYRTEPTTTFRPINASYNQSPLFNNYFPSPQGQQGPAERDHMDGAGNDNFYDGGA